MALHPVYDILPQRPAVSTMHYPMNSQTSIEIEIPQTKLGEIDSLTSSSEQHLNCSQILKTKIRILRFISRVGTTFLAIGSVCFESKTLSLYAHTHNITHGGRGPWARKTSLWPSILLLSVSAITVLLGIITIGAYAWSIRRANKINTVQTIVTVGIEVIHVVIWIAVAILYRKGKTGHDLWGWACSPLAEKIQPSFEGLVNFTNICQRGETNWVLSIVNPAFTIFNLSIWYFVWQRRKCKDF